MNTARRGFGEKFKRQQGKKRGFWTFFLKRFFLNKRSLRPTRSLVRTRARLTAVGMTTILYELKTRDRLKPGGMMTIFEKSKSADFERCVLR
jgi:hypothetical protein